MPEISVVMSVYNNASTVERAIGSILAQTYRDIEFIIINDGSTDESSAILRRYASMDKRIVLIEQDNQGLTRSLIRGIAAAKGCYIARQDADDASEAVRLERQMSFMPRYDVVAARSRREDGRPRPSVPVALLYRYSMAFKNPFYHGTLLFKKEIYERAGGYDAAFTYTQDYDLMARMIIKAKAKIKYMLQPLYQTGMSAGAISVAKLKEQTFFAEQVRKRLKLSWRGIAEERSCDGGVAA